MKKLIEHSFIRFLIIGGTNTLLDIVTYTVLLILSDNAYWSTIIAFLVAYHFSFFANALFTYKVKPTWKNYFQFPVIGFIQVILKLLIVWVWVDIANYSEFWPPYISAVLVLPITYILGKYLFQRRAYQTNT